MTTRTVVVHSPALAVAVAVPLLVQRSSTAHCRSAHRRCSGRSPSSVGRWWCRIFDSAAGAAAAVAAVVLRSSVAPHSVLVAWPSATTTRSAERSSPAPASRDERSPMRIQRLTIAARASSHTCKCRCLARYHHYTAQHDVNTQLSPMLINESANRSINSKDVSLNCLLQDANRGRWLRMWTTHEGKKTEKWAKGIKKLA